MKQIPLTQGKIALVDDEDYEWLSQWSWFASRSRGAIWYAKRGVKRADGSWTTTYMHIEITGIKGTDHVNRDGLNNQRSNIRAATGTQQIANTGRRSDNTSGFRGVYRNNGRWGKPWFAKLVEGGHQVHLGFFNDSEDAGRAYDAAAIKHFGEFACLNFPERKVG
jgi:hypothetical protein